jgi:hypothetical protein
MGMIGFGVFQARIGDRWVDVPSDVDPDDHPLQYWLEAHRPHRGFPPDFEVIENCHPISDDSIRPPESRGRNYPPGHFLRDKVLMGDHTHSWLDAQEILQSANAALSECQAFLAEREGTQEAVWAEGRLRTMRDFFDEVRRLVIRHGEVRLVFGITY